jgi:hypothetical protein
LGKAEFLCGRQRHGHSQQTRHPDAADFRLRHLDSGGVDDASISAGLPFQNLSFQARSVAKASAAVGNGRPARVPTPQASRDVAAQERKGLCRHLFGCPLSSRQPADNSV